MMDQKQKDKLTHWIEDLDRTEIVTIAVECIDRLSQLGVIDFSEETTLPYWKESKTYFDGSEIE